MQHLYQAGAWARSFRSQGEISAVLQNTAEGNEWWLFPQWYFSAFQLLRNMLRNGWGHLHSNPSSAEGDSNTSRFSPTNMVCQAQVYGIPGPLQATLNRSSFPFCINICWVRDRFSARLSFRAFICDGRSDFQSLLYLFAQHFLKPELVFLSAVAN